MIRNKLNSFNGWQRIGIVLSILWFFVAGITQRISDVDKAGEHASLSSQICYDAHRNSQFSDMDACSQKFQEVFDIWIKGSWGNSLFVAIIPIPIFWGLVILIIKIYRWIKKGFVK